MTKENLTRAIKQIAMELKFDRVGIAQAEKTPGAAQLDEWLAQGKHGEMLWMEKYRDIRKDIRKFFPQARSIIMVALNYYTPYQINDSPHTAKISRYAWGSDYHKILKKKLKRFLSELKKIDDGMEGRAFVDSAPVMEKQWAVLAGIGWQGKNTNVLTRDMGSWFFLGGLAVNRELIYDRPLQDYCGSCNACVEACPTDALKPYELDANRCISYLTIEYRDKPIPTELGGKLHNWVFGCDICQDVCPWNRFARETEEQRFHPKQPVLVNPPLAFLQKLSPKDFDMLFAGTPVRRARYANFKRNVQTVMDSRPGQDKKA
ncbi:tRNA epoxyqueuosine(34) reductase QueG [Caldithrix abyssi]